MKSNLSHSLPVIWQDCAWSPQVTIRRGEQQPSAAFKPRRYRHRSGAGLRFVSVTPLEPRRGGLFIAASAYGHQLNPVGVACLYQRLRKDVIIGSGALQTGHPYGVKLNVVRVRGSINRPPLRGLKQPPQKQSTL